MPRTSFSDLSRHTVCGILALAAAFVAGASSSRVAAADDPAGVIVGTPAGLSLEPKTFELKGARARLQMVLTGTYTGEETRDLTGKAAYTSSAPNVAVVEGSVVKPVANGAAKITAKVANLEATIDVTVTGLDQPSPISFKNQTLAALTKAGCNMGACHGSPSGKGGFRLSLRGFDAPLDINTLRTEALNRRVNLIAPAESLILKKPLMEVAHGGGRRLKKGDAPYVVLHDWIAEGMKVDEPTTPDLVKMEFFPKVRTLREGSPEQQLMVKGIFSDGSVRDITSLTVFSSSNEQVATVTELGKVEKVGRGETAILARCLDKMDTAYVTFLEDVKGFAWNNPPANNFVDTLSFEKLKQLQILPSDVCTDEEFLRRAYLDTTGRLPTLDETKLFHGDASADKRAKLVERLLDSDDFASYWSLKWCDILRANSKKLTASGVHKFRRWVYDAVRTDRPLDEFARELITGSGSALENPAAAYWRASRDPNDAVETTAQLFLGVRIQCAKCHNHPFERWSQDNYYGIAAAFTRIGRKKGALSADEEVVFTTAGGEISQPRTGKQMKVHLLLKGDVDDAPGQDRRAVFAQWLTAAENPFFAKCAVNRVWGHLMGRGIVEPVDDFRDSNPPSNARLLDELTKQFTQNKFSTKWAVRTIMNSRTYQLSSRKNDFNKDDEIYGSHANTRLLTAEQLLDAICAVTAVPEAFPGAPPGTRATELPEPPADHYFLKIFGQPQREMACQCERSSESNLSQALQMINGPTVHNKLRDANGRIAVMIKEGKTDDEIITTLYLAGLCRNPAPEEMEAARKHIATATTSAAPATRQQAMEDVGWAILNSKEFLFQH